MNFKNVTVAGAGVLGSQIAWQIAFRGFQVTVYDAFEKGLAGGKASHEAYARLFHDTRRASADAIEQAVGRLRYTTDLADAMRDADILSESVPENLEIKQAFYREAARHAPAKTVFTTNSSTMVPSQFAEFTGRPARFLALHFAAGVWDHNIGEVMGHAGTDPEVFQQVVDFAAAIGMVPIPIRKEQPGYVINTLVVPFLNAAAELLRNDVVDFESIDRTWMIGTGAPVGPCAIMDAIGMETVYNVMLLLAAQGDPNAPAKAAYFKTNFIDRNRLGSKTGAGFYSYPDPAFQRPGFLGEQAPVPATTTS